MRFSPALLALPMLLLAAPCQGQPISGPVLSWEEKIVDGIAYVNFVDLRGFYKFVLVPDAPFTYTNAAMSMALDTDNQAIIINGQRIPLLERLRQDVDGNLLISKIDCVKQLDPILRPAYIAKRMTLRRIVIDPFYGGNEIGSRLSFAGARVKESTYLFSFAKSLAGQLKAAGYEVTLTRDADYFVSRQSRVDLSNAAGDTLYLGLRLNQGLPEKNGVESYILAPARSAQPELDAQSWDEVNMALGLAMQSHLVSATKACDGGVRRLRYSYLNSIKGPAALLSLGYSSNEQELINLMHAPYQKVMQRAICSAAAAFANSVAPSPESDARAGQLKEMLNPKASKPEPEAAVVDEQIVDPRAMPAQEPSDEVLVPQDIPTQDVPVEEAGELMAEEPTAEQLKALGL